MKTYKFTLKMLPVSIFSILLFLLAIILNSFIFNNDIIIEFSFYNIIIMFIWFFIHELIHYLAFLSAKGVSYKDLVLGIELEKGVFYCMCKKEISKREIIISLLAPLILIGFITLIIGNIINNSLLVFLSLLNISGAAGDILMTLFFVKMPKDIKYLDKEDCTGFYVKTKSDIKNTKIFGITNSLVEENIIENNKYIRISKFSYVTIGIVLLISLISLI